MGRRPRRLPPAVQVEPDGDGRCTVDVGSDSPQLLALYLGMLDADFRVTGAPELAEHLRTLADRFRRAADQ